MTVLARRIAIISLTIITLNLLFFSISVYSKEDNKNVSPLEQLKKELSKNKPDDLMSILRGVQEEYFKRNDYA